MGKCVERVTTNEAFRESLLESPLIVLSESGLSDEEVHSVKNDDAWNWVRKNWAYINPSS
jgi:hypothetical protein